MARIGMGVKIKNVMNQVSKETRNRNRNRNRNRWNGWRLEIGNERIVNRG